MSLDRSAEPTRTSDPGQLVEERRSGPDRQMAAPPAVHTIELRKEFREHDRRCAVCR